MPDSIDSDDESISFREILRVQQPQLWSHQDGPYILDIDSLGRVNRWRVLNDDVCGPQKLRGTTPTDGTRLIVFCAWDDGHVGNAYRGPVDMLHFRKQISDWNLKYDQAYKLPDILVGGRSNVFDLGNGSLGVIFKEGNCNIVIISYSNIKIKIYRSSDHGYIGNDLVPPEAYIDALQKRPTHFFLEAHNTPLLLLLPLLYVHAWCQCQNLANKDAELRLSIMRHEMKVAKNVAGEVWCDLRFMKHDAMGPLDSVRRYDRHHNAGKLQKSKEFKHISKMFKSIHAEICRIEELARDFHQHQVAELSLQESYASIRLARVALDESKRTKLVTILAIFFVPISLSTAIFGMNIQELNNDGQSIWVFILTTVLVTIGTMILWGFMYQFQKYTSLPKKWYRYEGKSWHTRLVFLSQLVFRGHSIWAWRSGILFSLLTDGGVAFRVSCRSCSVRNPYMPCGYIRHHLGAPKYCRTPFSCSELEDISELKSWSNREYGN